MMKSVAKPKLLSVDVSFAPIDLQGKFARIVETVWQTNTRQDKCDAHSDNLFNPLVQRSLRAEL